MSIQDRDLQEWAHHPVTKHFRQLLLDSRQETMEVWAAQGYPDPLTNAGALGGIHVIDQTLDRIREWSVVNEPETPNE